MKSIFSALFIVFCCATQLFAQQFTGYVKRHDSLVIPVYQAQIEVTYEGKEISSQKTYFNGSYTFPTHKNQSYTIKVSYTGYVDTAFTITTDRSGKSSRPGFSVILKKDGMRLLGILRSADQNFPIPDADIVLKNIMTRKEDRQTTGIDGAYNFKLEYETNYRIYIDKRSPGIANKYKDTALYVSTIGFNLPLDYKLDISIERLANAVQDDISTGRQPFEKSTGPEAQGNKLAETTTASTEKPKREKESKSVPSGSSNPAKKKRKQKDKVEVVVIGDVPSAHVNQNMADTATVAKAAGKPITQTNADTALSAVAVAQKAARDSILAIRLAVEKKQQALAAKIISDDSIARINALQARKQLADSAKKAKADLAAAQKAKQDSLSAAKPGKEKQAKGLALKKAYDDSIAKAQIVIRRRAVADSVLKEKHLAAKELAAKKAAADSISHAKIAEQKLTRETALKKAKQDSIDRVASAAAQRKQTRDSLAKMKFEKEEIARELTAKKAFDDSLTRKEAAVRKLAIADSINKVTVEKELEAKQVLAKKASEDSISHVKMREKKSAQRTKKSSDDSIDLAYTQAVRHKQVRDSLAKANEPNAGFTQDSVTKAIYSKARAIPDADTKVKKEARKKFLQDSTQHVIAEKSLLTRKAVQDSLAELAYKARKRVVESILRLRAQQKNVERELKAEQARKDLAAQAAKGKNTQYSEDTSINYVSGKTSAAKDSVHQPGLTKRYKLIEDSITQAKAQLEIIAKQIDAKKVIDDSLQKLKSDAKYSGDKSGHAVLPKTYPIAKATETPFSDLPAVFFAKNSDTLDESQQINLKGIIEILNADKKSQIRLFAIASADENSQQKLAVKRSEVIDRYLKNAGIIGDRIRSAHPGSKISRNGCTNANCPEDLLKQNRCVVFQLLNQ